MVFSSLPTESSDTLGKNPLWKIVQYSEILCSRDNEGVDTVSTFTFPVHCVWTVVIHRTALKDLKSERRLFLCKQFSQELSVSVHCEHTNSHVIQRIYTEKKVCYKNLVYIWESVIIEVKKLTFVLSLQGGTENISGSPYVIDSRITKHPLQDKLRLQLTSRLRL
jgi:hypothetical protein